MRTGADMAAPESSKEVEEQSTGKRLFLVDGSNLLFQMFFGMPARIVNAQGKAIQGTLGFTGALLKMLRMVEPTHSVVLFDGEHENARSMIDADYKANRVDYSGVPEEENPFSQIQDVYAVLDFLRIKHMETTSCEADDLIAGYALSFGSKMQVVISSLDSDFFQLITDKVSVLRYRGKNTIIYTPERILEKFGIMPDRYADFKSLTGDTADHIRGADKIGAKTAAALVNEFGTLENILANAESIKRPSIKESIIKDAGRLRRNYQLIKLENKEPLPFDLHELAYEYDGLTTNEVLKGIGLK